MNWTERRLDIWLHYVTTLLFYQPAKLDSPPSEKTKLRMLHVPPVSSAVTASKDHSRPVWEDAVLVRRSRRLGTVLVPHNELADGDCQHVLIIPAEQTPPVMSCARRYRC